MAAMKCVAVGDVGVGKSSVELPFQFFEFYLFFPCSSCSLTSITTFLIQYDHLIWPSKNIVSGKLIILQVPDVLQEFSVNAQADGVSVKLTLCDTSKRARFMIIFYVEEGYFQLDCQEENTSLRASAYSGTDFFQVVS
jgi:hypothetical protein